MADLSFLKSFEKVANDMENVSSESGPPRYWHSSGNYVLNYILSGNFRQAIPQGRVTGLAGPSGSGKSFIQCSVAREAQQQDDTYILMIDTENALDDEFTGKIGIDTDDGYNYKSVMTIDDTVKLLSAFVKRYKKSYGTNAEAQKVLIIVDSLDMLLTLSELKNFDKGDHKGDQGQRAKQLKAFLRNMVQQLKNLNISMVITHQVYAATQEMILKGASDGNWVISGAVKYSLSHIALLTKLKLKEKDGKAITGIKMKCQAIKTRFTKPFQDVVIEVPYDEGMNPHSGLVDVAKALGILVKNGSYNKFADENVQFYAKDVAEYADKIFEKIDALDTTDLNMTKSLGLEEDMVAETKPQQSKRRTDADRLAEARKALKNKSKD